MSIVRLVAAAATLAILAACGPRLAEPPAGPESAAASPARTVTPMPTSGSPVPGATQPPGTIAYTSAKWLYTVFYPSDWFDLPNAGAPDNDKYFASKQVSVPEQLGTDGVLVSIIVNGDPSGRCAPAPDAPPGSTVSFGGVPATLISRPSSGGELWLRYKGWCYEFQYIVYSSAANSRYGPPTTMMMRTFRFNR